MVVPTYTIKMFLLYRVKYGYFMQVYNALLDCSITSIQRIRVDLSSFLHIMSFLWVQTQMPIPYLMIKQALIYKSNKKTIKIPNLQVVNIGSCL